VGSESAVKLVVEAVSSAAAVEALETNIETAGVVLKRWQAISN
jgi:hypothetical protein